MKFHHVCIWAFDYEKAIDFYVHKLGLTIHQETFSEKHQAKKVELYADDGYVIELFVSKDIFDCPQQKSVGIEHISFLVENMEEKLKFLKERGVSVIDAKEDALTGKLYGFCFDPDGTKIEFYNM